LALCPARRGAWLSDRRPCRCGRRGAASAIKLQHYFRRMDLAEAEMAFDGPSDGAVIDGARVCDDGRGPSDGQEHGLVRLSDEAAGLPLGDAIVSPGSVVEGRGPRTSLQSRRGKTSAFKRSPSPTDYSHSRSTATRIRRLRLLMTLPASFVWLIDTATSIVDDTLHCIKLGGSVCVDRYWCGWRAWHCLSSSRSPR